MITSLRVKACEHERVPAGLAWLAFLEINSMLTWYRMSSAFFRREDRLAAPPATGYGSPLAKCCWNSSDCSRESLGFTADISVV